MRRPPIRHTVKRHKRKGKIIKSFERGRGQPSRKRKKVVGAQTQIFSQSDIKNISKIAKQSSDLGKEYFVIVTLDNGHGIIGNWITGKEHHIPTELLIPKENQFMLHTHPDTPPEYIGQYEPASPSFGDLYQHTVLNQDILGIASHEQGVVKIYFMHPARKTRATEYAQKWRQYLEGPIGLTLDDKFEDEMEEYLRLAWTSTPPKVYSLNRGGKK